MTIYYINTGSSANKGDGDTLRTAFNKINANFEYLSTATFGGFGTGTIGIATQNTLGIVKGSENIMVMPDGSLQSVVINTATNGITFTTAPPDINGFHLRTWSLVPGTDTTLGGVKSGNNIMVMPDGSLESVIVNTATNGITFTTSDPGLNGFRSRSWRLLPATTSTLGGVKAYPGGSISIQPDGVISVATQYVNGTGTMANIVWPDDGVTPPVISYDVLPATGAALGGVKIGAGVQVDVDGTISVTTGAFALQTATNTILGGVKIGGGFSIAPDGTISAQSPLVPISDTPPGGASDGELWWSSNATNLYIRYSGAWIDASPTSGSGSSYTLTTATSTALGGVKIGANINIDGNGVISVTTGSYTLTTATHIALGGVKIGAGINVAGDGTISVTTGSFALQAATDTILGGVKVGAGLAVTVDGTLSALVTTGTQAVYIADVPPFPSYEGELWWDSNSNNLLINYSGIWLDATPATPPPSPYVLPTATQSILGGVKIDNVTITIDQNGIISAGGGGGGGSTTWALLGNKNNSSGPDTIALGTNAGFNVQGLYGIALGSEAAVFNQGQWSVAIGPNAGRTTQAYSSVAIGQNSGYSLQGPNAVAIGVNAGNITQGEGSVAIGEHAGETNQGNGGIHSVAVGDNAGNLNQGTGATALGPYSGQFNQGPYALALGYMAGVNSQTALSIVLNATGQPVNAYTSGLYIAPVRADASTSATTWGVFYNPITKELTTSTAAVGSGGGGGGGSYVLPIASTSTLGGIKIGTGFTEFPAGTFNVNPIAMSAATSSTLGGVKVSLSSSIVVDPNGFIDIVIINTTTNGIYYTTGPVLSDGRRNRTWGLNVASAAHLGGVAIGEHININTSTGAISVPLASTTTQGVVKVYAGGVMSVSTTDGTINFAASFANGTGTQHVTTWPDDGITPPIFITNLLPATTSSLGGIIADGTTITIDANGVVSSVASGSTATQFNGGTITEALIISTTTNTIGNDTGALQVAGGAAIDLDLSVGNAIFIGPGSAQTTFINPTIIARNAGQTYIQAALINSDGRGSADWVAYADNGTSDYGWADMGYTGSTFNDPNYTITGEGSGYFFVQGTNDSVSHGSLTLATGNGGVYNDIVFATGGFLIENEKMRFVHATGQLHIQTTTTATNTSTGALRVDGGVGIGGDIRLAGGLYAKGYQVYPVVQSATTPDATTSTLWFDTVGGRQYIYYNGSWVDTNPVTSYILPTASTSSIGGVRIGTGISIDNSGTISVIPVTTVTWATLVDVNNANGPDKIALGTNAGTTQQTGAIAIGLGAGNIQNYDAIAIGNSAGGFGTQGQEAVAIGIASGQTDQGTYAVAIGSGAGQNTQTSLAVAIGYNAGQTNQGGGALAVGNNAGQITQQTDAIAIGTNAGNTNQGAFAIAIGTNAGITDQPSQSIVINATAANLSGTQAGFYVDPIRESAVTNVVAYYNTSTKEVTYGPAAPVSTSTLVNGLHTLTLNIDGAITTNGTDTNVYIETVGTDTNHLWTFDSTGTIVFPDGTQQTTAYQSNFGQPNQLTSGTTVVSLISTATGYFNQGHSVSQGELNVSTGTYLVFEGPLETNNWTGAIGDGVSTGSLAIYTDVGPLELFVGGYGTKTSFELNGGFRPKILTAAPTNAVAGTFFTADGVSWDPATKGLGVPYPVFFDGATYNPLY